MVRQLVYILIAISNVLAIEIAIPDCGDLSLCVVMVVKP